MCPTCVLLRLNVNVCGIVIEDDEVSHPELPKEVADALVDYTAGIAAFPTRVRVGDSRATAPGTKSHSATLTRVSRSKFLLCFHTLVPNSDTGTCG